MHCDMTNELLVHVAVYDKLCTPIIDITSLLKYEAMCDMRNEVKFGITWQSLDSNKTCRYW